MGKRFDALLFPGRKHKAFTLSYDDGVVQDRRLIELFDFLVFLLKTVRQSEVFLIIQSSKRTFIAGKIGFRREGDFDVLIIEFPCAAKRKERVSF